MMKSIKFHVLLSLFALLTLLLISCSKKVIDPSDKWFGNWGSVVIHGNEGKYSDIYGTGFGKFKFSKTGEQSFSGTWGESEKYYGTMTFTVSESGKYITGTYKASKECEINPGSEGSIYWQRYRAEPRVYNVDYSFELVPDPATIDRVKDLKLWLPIPREWESQKAVKIVSVQPSPHATYVDPEHGNHMLYWDFGKEPEKSSYKVEIKFSLESYKIHTDVDPERIGSYDKTSKEYVLYTRNTHTISITPAIREMAQIAIGEESNPYLQAIKIGKFVGKKMRYKVLDYVRGRGIKCLLDYPVIDQDTGEEYYEGCCNQYCAFFVALCRAVRIPARTVSGFVGYRPWLKEEDLKPRYEFESELSPNGLAGGQYYGYLGVHMWAEFYIPNYGWIPINPGGSSTGYLNNKRIIRYKGRDILIDPEIAQKNYDGYGSQWVALHQGRADNLFYGVWNIAKIHTAKVKIVHYSDLFPIADK